MKNGFDWIRIALTATILYPLLRFLDYKVPRKPKVIKIHKHLTAVRPYLLENDFVLFESDTGPWAVSRRCTHLGCRLNYSEKDNLLICPCHKSRFTTAGKRVAGPARKDLARYSVKTEEENQSRIYVVTI